MALPESDLDILPALEIAILERLQGAIPFVENAVFPQSCPPGQSYPYIDYTYIRGGELNDSPRQEIDVTYLIVGRSDDYLKSMRLASLINDAMTKTILALPVPYRTHWQSRDALYMRKRNMGNFFEFGYGAYYHIKAHLTGDIDRRILSYGS